MKDSPEFKRLIESQAIECKKSLNMRTEAMEALCGMVNSEMAYGVIYFGVAPDGSIVGLGNDNLDTAQRSLTDHVRQKFDPPLITMMQVEEWEGKQVLGVVAKRDKSIPYHEYDGRAYIREGSSRRLLSLAEKERISRTRDRVRHNGPWRCSKCGAFVGQLNAMVITDFNKPPQRTFDCPCGGEYWPV